MHNWDARDELGTGHCTLDSDWESVQKTCKVLKIDKLHRVNFQSSYWQRVFDPIIEGYAGGKETPNPDILCNREIKFGDLFKWATDEVKADALATGHYARIFHDQLRQSHDLGKDQTYFLSAVNRKCWSKTVFPIGGILKSQVKENLVKEAKLNFLIGRKESMGICFVGKRDKFKSFLGQFISSKPDEPGPIINIDTNQYILEPHKGLSFYTLGQSARVGGAGRKLYVARKSHQDNTLYVVDRQDHSLLNRYSIVIKNDQSLLKSLKTLSPYPIFCSIRSSDKIGSLVTSVDEADGCFTINLRDPVYAPCPGQWAVFYAEDEQTHLNGRLCLGGSPIK